MSQQSLINQENSQTHHHHHHLHNLHKPSSTMASNTSSPSHEFSFTISLTKPSPPPPEFDLSPADDIFFRGHLLPLHFLSHRPSDASLQTDLKLPQNSVIEPNDAEFNQSIKPKLLSSFFSIPKWLRKEPEKQRKKKRNKMFSGLWKAILFFKELKERRRSSYSFSGDFNPREGGWRRRWRGEFSAPASMRTSPANSGVLVAAPSTFSSSDESSMEELQNAIQAAIAHCKSSVGAKESKCEC